jgi:hypothetical protein
MAIGAQQAAIRAVTASALAEHVSASGQSVDALVAIRRAEAIVKARTGRVRDQAENVSRGDVRSAGEKSS